MSVHLQRCGQTFSASAVLHIMYDILDIFEKNWK